MVKRFVLSLDRRGGLDDPTLDERHVDRDAGNLTGLIELELLGDSCGVVGVHPRQDVFPSGVAIGNSLYTLLEKNLMKNELRVNTSDTNLFYFQIVARKQKPFNTRKPQYKRESFFGIDYFIRRSQSAWLNSHKREYQTMRLFFRAGLQRICSSTILII